MKIINKGYFWLISPKKNKRNISSAIPKMDKKRSMSFMNELGEILVGDLSKQRRK